MFPWSERRLRTTRRRRRQHLLAGCALMATVWLLVPFRLALNQSDRPLIGRRLMDTGPRLRARPFPRLWAGPFRCGHSQSPAPSHPVLCTLAVCYSVPLWITKGSPTFLNPRATRWLLSDVKGSQFARQFFLLYQCHIFMNNSDLFEATDHNEFSTIVNND